MKLLRALTLVLRWLVAISALLIAAYLALWSLAIMGVYGRTSGALKWIEVLSGPFCLALAAVFIAPISDRFLKWGWQKTALIALCVLWAASPFLGLWRLTPKSWVVYENQTDLRAMYGHTEEEVFSINCYSDGTVSVYVLREALPGARWEEAPITLSLGEHTSRLNKNLGIDQDATSILFFDADPALLEKLAAVEDENAIVIAVENEKLDIPIGSARAKLERFASSCLVLQK